MGWDWLKKGAQRTVEHAPGVVNIAARAGVPYAGAIDSAIRAAQERGGPGRDRAQYAYELVLAGSEDVLAAVEREIGRPVPPAAAVQYVRDLIEAHHRLLKAAGAIE